MLSKRNDPATTAENRALLDEALQQQRGVQLGATAAAATGEAATLYLRERDPRVQQHQHLQGNPVAAAVGSTQQQQQLSDVLAAASSMQPPPAFLQVRSCSSRRHSSHTGATKPKALQQLNLRLQRQQQLLGLLLRQPDLGPECQLCFDHAGSLMWSGEVRWQTADRLLRGSFRACGHLFTPAAAVDGSSSSSEVYWLRYSRLPPVLEFVVGCGAKSFERDVWQAPAAAGSTS
jgi:hypothetical protein